MNRVLAQTLLCTLGLVSNATAVADAAPAPGTPAAGMPAFVRDIEPGAAAAVKVVDAFSAAIKAGKLDEAGRLLDPKLLVLESGGGERSRDQYMAEHAPADAKYMKTVEQDLRYRKARVVGEMAWVATESILTRREAGLTKLSLNTETMLLRNTKDGWKIVHIHWSSRSVG